MVQILKDRPSFGQLLARGGGQAVGEAGLGALEGVQEKKGMLAAQGAMNRENEAIRKELGIDLSGIQDPKMRQLAISEALKGGREQLKSQQELREKIAPLQKGLQTVNEMKRLKDSGHLGWKASQGLGFGLLSGDVRRDRSKYEQLGKSLIPLASSIPIRNQMEFETLSNRLYDPTLTDAEIEGTLDAMEQLIQSSLSSYGLGRQEESGKISDADKMAAEISSFWE